MKQILSFLLLIAVALPAAAQKGKVSGKVVDSTGEALPGATVVIMRQDSTQVTGQQTSSDGSFSISSIKDGD